MTENLADMTPYEQEREGFVTPLLEDGTLQTTEDPNWFSIRWNELAALQKDDVERGRKLQRLEDDPTDRAEVYERGREDASTVPCPTCKGIAGTMHIDDAMPRTITVECPTCNGEKRIPRGKATALKIAEHLRKHGLRDVAKDVELRNWEADDE